MSIIQPPPASEYGAPARSFLEAKGLVSRVPTIRSSDFDMVNSCRFLYYLRRRIGLGSAFSSRTALRRGSWFHTRFEAIGRTPEGVNGFMQQKLKDRTDELRATGHGLDLGPESIAKLVGQERDDALCTWAWYEAAAQFRLAKYPLLAKGFEAYLTDEAIRILAKEVRLVLKHPTYSRSLLVAELDELRYNPTTNTLWIVDAKTCSGAPLHRIEALTVEPQPRHYIFIVDQLLHMGILQKKFGLPEDVRLGGFIHVVIQKPEIEMGQNDRPYVLKVEGVRKKMHGQAMKMAKGWECNAASTGERFTAAPHLVATEAQAELWLQEQCGKLPDRHYSGEPSREMYKQRCIHWYRGTGDYESKKADRESELCPVNISIINRDAYWNKRTEHEYTLQLNRVYENAIIPACPENFDRTTAGLINPNTRKPTELAAFYNASVSAWPTIVRENALIQEFRDEDLDLDTDSCIM